MSRYIFTSESVSEGHPDKIADQISDAILDAHIAVDPNCHIACETIVKDNRVILAGEISSRAVIDHEQISRQVVKEIGYTQDELGFNSINFAFEDYLSQQSPEINMGVDKTDPKRQGAGDQGLVFGYACNDNAALLPAPIYLAHQLTRNLAKARQKKYVNWLRPDAKSQVSVKYRNGEPVGIDTVVISTQHSPDVSQKEIKAFVIDGLIPESIPSELIEQSRTRILVNPTGSFVTGGPLGDCGLTGRKIIVDTYGGYARHGGGAFSGKDPSKVDRSAAYAARQVARSVVSGGYATHCEVQISYAIGVARPTSIYINTFGTGLIPNFELEKMVSRSFDLTPYGIINSLGLLKPIYQQTASYGHFGRTDLDLPWEIDVELKCSENIHRYTRKSQEKSKKGILEDFGNFQGWRAWAEQQSGYKKIKGELCQCGTEKCIKQSQNPEAMRAFLLVNIFCDQLIAKYFAEAHKAYKRNFPTPLLIAHMSHEQFSASWLIYSRHNYDQNLDWAIISEIINSTVCDVIEFLSDNLAGFDKNILFKAINSEVEEQFEIKHKTNLQEIFSSLMEAA